MIAVDTNILVYAHRADSSFHVKAKELLTDLTETGKSWAIPWPCFHEFYAVVTNTRLFTHSTPSEKAFQQIELWMESPTLQILSETIDHWSILKRILTEGKIVGGMTHDARIIALCEQHNVKTLWTADRDFGRMRGVKVVNPLT